MRLKEKVVIVKGGERGIGEEKERDFIREGEKVVIEDF